MRILILCVFSILPLFAVQAAEKPTPPLPSESGGKSPCAIDIERFCKDVPMGGGRRIACLNNHKNALTPACRERVPKLQALFEFGLAQQKKTDAALAKNPQAPKQPTTSQQKKPMSAKSGE